MNIKRIVLVTIIVMIAVSSLSVISAGFVSAADDTLDSQHGIKFKIPEGYEVNKEDHGISDYSVKCTNDNGDSFSINLERSYSGELNLFGESTDIGGKEGVMREYSNGMVGFFYIDDDYQIEIKAPDESTIAEIIGYD